MIKYPDLRIFEEGYNKDYVYEERDKIPILQGEHVEMSTLISNQNDHLLSKLSNSSKRGLIGGISPVLLTMRGAIKFNMWKL